jgi:SAM-dependent methyltransferase
MSNIIEEIGINLDELRAAISEEYSLVASEPEHGFHFHTGRPLTHILGYDQKWLENIPDSAVNSFAGTGNPFSLGELQSGEHVVDIGSGAGMDSLIAANMVGEEGHVIGIDMTPAMLDKARAALAESGLQNVTFRHGYAEELPVAAGWADVIISNGVMNLFPDKGVALQEMARVLQPNGRLQIADIVVQKPVPTGAKQNIDLWTG